MLGHHSALERFVNYDYDYTSFGVGETIYIHSGIELSGI